MWMRRRSWAMPANKKNAGKTLVVFPAHVEFTAAFSLFHESFLAGPICIECFGQYIGIITCVLNGKVFPGPNIFQPVSIAASGYGFHFPLLTEPVFVQLIAYYPCVFVLVLNIEILA